MVWIDEIDKESGTAVRVVLFAWVLQAPSEKQVADKCGVMAWSFDAQPGETKEIRLAYRA